MPSLSNKTLILRFSSVGDIVLASPLIRAVRRKFPESRIDFVVKSEFAGLVRHNPYLTSVIEFSPSRGIAGLTSLRRTLRSTGYDTVIDIHNNFRSIYLRTGLGARYSGVVDKRVLKRTLLVLCKWNWFDGCVSTADRYLETVRPLGITDDGRGTEIFVPPAVQEKTADMWRSFRLPPGRPVIAFAHSARHETKMWPVERFAELGFHVIRNGGIVVLLGSRDETTRGLYIEKMLASQGAPASSVVNLTGKLELLQAAAAMDFFSVVVANDSGLLHVAEARKRRVVGIFGPTVREFGFFPQGRDSQVVERTGLSCRPCSHLGGTRCPKGHFRCMLDIAPEQIFETIQTLLSTR